MQVIKCQRVDLWDGGSLNQFGFYISDKVSVSSIETAYPHCTVYPQLITVFDSVAERNSHTTLDLKRTAWDKLNDLERHALGMPTRP